MDTTGKAHYPITVTVHPLPGIYDLSEVLRARQGG